MVPQAGAYHQTGVAVKEYLVTPRVLDLSNPEPIRFHVTTLGSPARVEIVPVQGEKIILEKLAANEWEALLSKDQVLNNHEPGLFHQLLGRIRLYAGPTDAAPAFDGFAVSLVKPEVPTSPIVRVSDEVQYAPHVLNVRYDERYHGRPPPKALLQRVYGTLGDDYDFLAIIEPVDSVHNRFYMGIRNHVKGLGLPEFDTGADYGSHERLQGIISFPIASYFDAAEHAMNHEIGHRWAAFLKFPTIQGAAGGGHWPLSDVAYGIMGFSLSGGEGGAFPYELVPLPTGDYQLKPVPSARHFNDLELYLMGLIPKEQVKPHVVMHVQDRSVQEAFMARGYLKGPAYEATIDAVIANHGARDPPFGAAPRDFKVAVVVLSAGRLLSAAELTFFDLVAARAEATTELPYRQGLSTGKAVPFYLATGGRSTLSTTLDLPAAPEAAPPSMASRASGAPPASTAAVGGPPASTAAGSASTATGTGPGEARDEEPHGGLPAATEGTNPTAATTWLAPLLFLAIGAAWIRRRTRRT